MGIPQGKAHTVHMYINLASVPAVGQVFHCIQNWLFERHSYSVGDNDICKNANDGKGLAGCSLAHQLLGPVPAIAAARVSTDTEEINYEHKNNALANGTLGSVKNVI